MPFMPGSEPAPNDHLQARTGAPLCHESCTMAQGVNQLLQGGFCTGSNRLSGQEFQRFFKNPRVHIPSRSDDDDRIALDLVLAKQGRSQ